MKNPAVRPQGSSFNSQVTNRTDRPIQHQDRMTLFKRFQTQAKACGYKNLIKSAPYFSFLIKSFTGIAARVRSCTDPLEPSSTDIFITASLFGASTIFTKS